PAPPVFVNAETTPTPTNDATVTWAFRAASGSGDHTFRMKLDADLDNGSSTETVTGSAIVRYTRTLAEGVHTLYVQERSLTGQWSNVAQRAIMIDLSAPSKPTISGPLKTSGIPAPTWSWTSGGGGNGIYELRVAGTTISTNYTQTNYSQTALFSQGQNNI